jgi:hypothetical protein
MIPPTVCQVCGQVIWAGQTPCPTCTGPKPIKKP